MCGPGGDWNYELPSCEEISCKLPPEIAHGVLAQPEQDTYKVCVQRKITLAHILLITIIVFFIMFY